jgi:enediyne biosynthesis protein E5
MADPRLYQIGVLSGLLVYGMAWLDFEITVPRAVLLLGTVLATQALCDRFDGPRPANWKSALISGLSLCLLLRTNRPELAALAAIVTIAGKFLFRIQRKHLFNPTNGGIVAMLLLTDEVWVSPGQWGSVAFFGFLMACLGGLVVNRASRSDVTYAFVASYCALMFGRSLYLGEPMTIPVHRLQSGALLLFTFFMISDPKTTPDSRAGRVLFAALVAFSAWYVQFRLFRTNGLLWSLAAWSMAVPLIDRLLPGTRYTWRTESLARRTVVRTAPSTEGARHRSWGCPPSLFAMSAGEQLRRGLAVARECSGRAAAEGPTTN